MNRKRILLYALVTMIFIGITLVSYPFIVSIGLSAKTIERSLHKIEIPDLVAGELHVQELGGFSLFVLKPSKQQLEAIKTLNSHVWDKNSNAFDEKLGAYVYWGHSTTRWECLLEILPAQESRLIDYQPDAKWLGGYWNWQCEVSYDYAGRAIRTYSYTYNGYNRKHPNLKKPLVFKESYGKYIVSIFQR